ncbi:MAG TPA: hypothetical protein VLF93_07420 [Candidatus Saccharimonadales bacterium]|nr:hypothetical protein [Candidatus Saccharimonadales bacterium]
MERYQIAKAEFGQQTIEHSLDEIYARGWKTASRIREKIPNGFLGLGPVYLRPYLPPLSLAVHGEGFPVPPELADAATIAATDNAPKVFGHKNFYTIASSLALDSLQDKEQFLGIEEVTEGGVLLLPTMEHFEQDVYTHKGVGLSLLSGLMRIVGMDLGHLDRFVWLGQQVDPEQWVMEDTIAQRGREIDRELRPFFYEGNIFNHTLNPYLKKILSGVMEGENHYNDDSECRQYVNEFLDAVHRNRGIRGSWYRELEGILKGEIPPQFTPDLTPDMLDARLFSSWRHNKAVPKESQVMLCEIDAERYYETVPIHPLHIGARHPDNIVPAPSVLASTVKTVYLNDFDNIPTGLGLLNAQIRHISELPEDRWLPDTNGRPVTPERVRSVGIDPRNPICSARYAVDPVTVWQRHIHEGTIAPMFIDVPLTNLQTPQRMAEKSLRQLLLTNYGHSSSELDEELRSFSIAGVNYPALPSLHTVNPLPPGKLSWI